MKSYRIAQNTVNISDLRKHLILCSEHFFPPLKTYVNVNDYAKKIYDKAETFEMWSSNKLISLIACYFNEEDLKEVYITNISTIPGYQGLHLATTLLEEVKKQAKKRKIYTINLQVKKVNYKAISYYRKQGFQFNEILSSDDSYGMSLNQF